MSGDKDGCMHGVGVRGLEEDKCVHVYRGVHGVGGKG